MLYHPIKGFPTPLLLSVLNTKKVVPANIYLFKFNNRNARKTYQIRSKLMTKTLERRSKLTIKTPE